MANVGAKKDSDVIGVTFSNVTLRRIDALIKKGSHGAGRPEIIRNFVEEGIRQAMKDGFIPMAD